MGRSRYPPGTFDGWVRLFSEGVSASAIAEDYGCTRAYVCQKLRAAGIDPRRAWLSKVTTQAADARGQYLYEATLAAMAKAVPCVVCGSWVIRPPLRPDEKRTCSPECAKVWPKVRYRIDPDEYEAHRVKRALTILKRPGKYKPAHIRWAQAMLSDNPPPPNRRFVVPGSLTSQAVESLGRG